MKISPRGKKMLSFAHFNFIMSVKIKGSKAQEAVLNMWGSAL